jgi:hypothetical protein
VINLLFSGDFAPLTDAGHSSGADLTALKELINSCDLHITNLECPITSSEKCILKTGPSIKANPGGAELLKMAGVGLACLANNHIFDFGEEGLSDTIELCRKNGIGIAGIVTGDGRETGGMIYEIKGTTIGFLNYCEHEFSVRDKGLTGACGYDPVDAFHDIMRMREEADRVIVIYHGGNEYYPLPRPDLKKDFHFLADVGADAVIGHHTHVYSGVEIYGGKPLVYSLGNLFFPLEGEPESWKEGVICRLTLDDGVTVELIPVIQCRNGLRVEMPSEAETKEILTQIDLLSGIIADDNELKNRWESYTVTTGFGLANQLLYPTKADKLMLKIPWLRRYVNDPVRLRSLINVLRCRSLEQLLIGNLKSRKW